MTLADYSAFVASKLTHVPPTGLRNVPALSPALFPFQADLVTWALRRGRCAIFADTGLGKTAMTLEWAKHITAHTQKPTLILAPLAVGRQTQREGERCGVAVNVVRENYDVHPTDPAISITNYDRIHKFDTSIYGAVVLDESSIIKHHTAKTLTTLLAAFSETPFRLCATATPSPNDYTELGTHAEFLGICTREEMLAEFFCHDGGETQVWRLKKHARKAFWRWVATWGAMLRRPADLGYDSAGYDLPPLVVQNHTLAADPFAVRESGFLFAMPAGDMTERRKARRASLSARVQTAADLVMRCTCGSRSTQTADVNGTPLILPKETKGKLKHPANLDTCGPTISPTSTGGILAQENSGTRTTPLDASSTPTARPSEAKPKQKRRRGKTPIQTGDTLNASESTDLLLSSTPSCSPSNAVDVPYVAGPRAPTETLEPAEPGSSLLTTVTKPDASVAFYVHHATSASASSETIQNGLNERQCTCEASEKWIVWVDLNDEQRELEKLFGDQCVSIYGTLDPDQKERRIEKFIDGRSRILLTKASMFGFGVNLQMCARMAFVGVTDSWEAYYQAVRRCYRFGQKRPVHVHIYASEVEGSVVANLQRKEKEAAKMAEELTAETREALLAEIRGSVRSTNTYESPEIVVPSWLVSEAAQ